MEKQKEKLDKKFGQTTKVPREKNEQTSHIFHNNE